MDWALGGGELTEVPRIILDNVHFIIFIFSGHCTLRNTAVSRRYQSHYPR